MNLSDETKKELLRSLSDDELEAERKRRKEPEELLRFSRYAELGLRLVRNVYGDLQFGDLQFYDSVGPIVGGYVSSSHVRYIGRDMIDLADREGW